MDRGVSPGGPGVNELFLSCPQSSCWIDPIPGMNGSWPRPPVIQERGREGARGAVPQSGEMGRSAAPLTRRPTPPAPAPSAACGLGSAGGLSEPACAHTRYARAPGVGARRGLGGPSCPAGEGPWGPVEPRGCMYLILNPPRNPMGRAFFHVTEVETLFVTFPKSHR